MTTDKSELIRKLPIFSELTESEANSLIEQTKEIEVSSGEIVFKEGDESGSLYIVIEGLVEISVRVLDDFQKPLVSLREGEIFGEVSLIDKNPREVQAKTLEDSKLLVLSQEAFDKTVEEQPEIGSKVLKKLIANVVRRLRFTADEYRRNTQWGLGVSGALELNWHRLITDETDLKLDFLDQQSLQGTLLKVEKNDSGLELFIGDKDHNIFIVPYHAVRSISFLRADPISSAKK